MMARLVSGIVQIEVVGDEAAGFFARQFLDDGVAAGDDPHLASGRELRTGVAVFGGHLSEAGGDVEFRNSGRGGADALGMIGRLLADFAEDALLDFEDLLFGREHLDFVFLQLGRGEALGVDEGLLALVIGGRVVQIGA